MSHISLYLSISISATIKSHSHHNHYLHRHLHHHRPAKEQRQVMIGNNEGEKHRMAYVSIICGTGDSDKCFGGIRKGGGK